MCLPCIQQWYRLTSLIVGVVGLIFVLWPTVLLLQEPWVLHDSAGNIDLTELPDVCRVLPHSERRLQYTCHHQKAATCDESSWCSGSAGPAECNVTCGRGRGLWLEAGGLPCWLLRHSGFASFSADSSHHWHSAACRTGDRTLLRVCLWRSSDSRLLCDLTAIGAKWL
eukprot:TRINITY_DN25494_c0_g1_i2.p1 TRINITY_DN25494_c0_g1~~TRINITY_DN25494_c0_g1_i2.p1  ORF type:complete len:168 (-),score=9.56 TRINITY_DN25494_c0_g1_i2:581-1084(-)